MINDKNEYVPNWFDKEHFEEMLGCSISQDSYEQICRYLDDRGELAGDISSLLESHTNRIIFLKNIKPELTDQEWSCLADLWTAAGNFYEDRELARISEDPELLADLINEYGDDRIRETLARFLL